MDAAGTVLRHAGRSSAPGAGAVRIFLPQSARGQSRGQVRRGGAEPAGRVAIGTVKGDVHDIGKNLVAAMLEGGGPEVIDPGADVPAEGFVATVLPRPVDVICRTATMPAIRAAGVREQAQIGADGYGENAVAAVAVARRVVAVHAIA